MDHAQAITTQATERYLLKELTPEEREEFEEHFFGCPACADAMSAGAAVLEGTRLLSEKGRLVSPAHKVKSPVNAGQITEMPIRSAPPSQGWQNAWAAAAAGVLVIVCGYQNLITIPHLQRTVSLAEAPQEVSLVVLRPAARGAASVVRQEGKAVVLSLEANSDRPLQTYEVSVQTSQGATLFNVPSVRAASSGAIDLELPSAFAPGEYEILVRESDAAGKATEVSRFTLQLGK